MSGESTSSNALVVADDATKQKNAFTRFARSLVAGGQGDTLGPFLSCYRLFVTKEEMIEIWRRTYWHSRKDEAKCASAISFLESWMREFPRDFGKQALADLLQVVRKRAPPEAFKRLQLASLRANKERTATGLSGRSASLPDGMTPRDILLENRSNEIAMALSAADWRLFSQIGVDELVSACWNPAESEKIAPHLSKMAAHFNSVSWWVATEIIVRSNDAKERKKIMEKFISVATACGELRNFNSLLAILSGLNHIAVARIKALRSSLSVSAKTKLKRLEELMDPAGNVASYRRQLELPAQNDSDSPDDTPRSKWALPVFSLLLKELEFLRVGNELFISNKPNTDLIALMWERVSQLRRCQAEAISVSPSAENFSYAFDHLDYADDDQLYVASTEIESTRNGNGSVPSSTPSRNSSISELPVVDDADIVTSAVGRMRRTHGVQREQSDDNGSDSDSVSGRSGRSGRGPRITRMQMAPVSLEKPSGSATKVIHSGTVDVRTEMSGKFKTNHLVLYANGAVRLFKNESAIAATSAKAPTWKLDRYEITFAKESDGMFLFLNSRSGSPLQLSFADETACATWLGALRPYCRKNSVDWPTERILESHFLDPALSASRVGIITNANKALCEYLNWNRSDIIGQRIEVLMPPGLGKIHGALVGNYHRTGSKSLIGTPRMLPVRSRDGMVSMAELTLSEDDVGAFMVQMKPCRDTPLPSKYLKMRVLAESSTSAEESGSDSASSIRSEGSGLDLVQGDDSTALAALQHATANAAKSGYLQKKGGVFSKWGQRYFVLHDRSLLLEFPNAEKIGGPDAAANSLELKHCELKLASGITGMPNSFALMPSINTKTNKRAKPWFLVAPSHAALVEWAASLKPIVKSFETEWVNDTTLENHFLDPTVAASANGIITHANQKACDFLGWKLSDLVGKPVEILMPPGLSKIHGAIMQRYNETNKRALIGQARELPVRKADGSLVRAVLSLSEDSNAAANAPWKFLVQMRPVGKGVDDSGKASDEESMTNMIQETGSEHVVAMMQQLSMFSGADGESTDSRDLSMGSSEESAD